MTWTAPMRRGAGVVAAGTLIVTLVSLGLLWPRAEGVAFWDFVKLGLVVVLVWAAIGGTMGFFIVMILKKNQGKR